MAGVRGWGRVRDVAGNTSFSPGEAGKAQIHLIILSTNNYELLLCSRQCATDGIFQQTK